jgi:hypothetical protein
VPFVANADGIGLHGVGILKVLEAAGYIHRG